MKIARNVALMLAVAFAVGACDDDDPTDEGGDIVVADLAGSYSVSTFEYEEDDTGNSFDLRDAQLGLTEITVQSNGDFDGTLAFPQGTFAIGGTILLSNTTSTGGTLTINFDAATQALGVLDAQEIGTFTWDASSETLTMVLTEVTVPAGTPGLTAEANADLTMVVTRL